MQSQIEKIVTMPYVDFMAFLKETNRAPGWEKMLIEMVKNVFLHPNSKFLHIACNTGSSTREVVKLTGASGYWIDINENMVKTATELTGRENMDQSLTFKAMNAQELAFPDKEFELVFSAGWIAFVPDKKKAVSEMVRVCKDSWFVADIVMYYKGDVPQYVIDEMNGLMNLNIQKWWLGYWIDIYESQGLKLFHKYEGEYALVDHKKLLEYCRYMVNRPELSDLSEDEKKTAEYKLFRIMSLFSENHKYLGASLLIFRKESVNEQWSLFSE